MAFILSIQTKGGCGKSTCSQQILAPYFLAKNEPVTLIEIDDENLDSSYLLDSAVKTEQFSFGTSASAERVVESLFSRVNENLVVDVGGNRTATNFIAAAGRFGLFEYIDLVVIPISGPGQDETNAIRTANAIKAVAPAVKIMMVVTRQPARSDAEFDDIFKRYFDVEELEKITTHICHFPHVMAMIHSRYLEMTLYEMAIMRDKLINDLANRMMLAAKSGSTAAALKIGRVRSSVQESHEILPFIEACHRVIDNTLEGLCCTNHGLRPSGRMTA